MVQDANQHNRCVSLPCLLHLLGIFPKSSFTWYLIYHLDTFQEKWLVILWNALQFVWYVLLIRFGLCIFINNATEVLCPSQRILSEGTQYPFAPLVLMLTMIFRSMCSQRGDTVKHIKILFLIFFFAWNLVSIKESCLKNVITLLFALW